MTRLEAITRLEAMLEAITRLEMIEILLRFVLIFVLRLMLSPNA